jgi:ribosomal protein S27AE
MSKKTCSNCGNVYWVNVHMDNEFACPKCGFVENDKIEGQLKGRLTLADD